MSTVQTQSTLSNASPASAGNGLPGVDHPPWQYLEPMASLPSSSVVFSASVQCNSSGSDYDVVASQESQLTLSPDSRARPCTALPSPHHTYSAFPEVAISASNNIVHNNQRQDVRYSVVNPSAASSNSSTAPRYNVSRTTTPLESPSLSSFASFFPDNGSVDNHEYRTQSSNTVFSTSQDLAAHYGIPQILPPAPRTTPGRQPISVPPTPQPLPDFAALRANYLDMLSGQPTNNTMTAESTPPASGTTPAASPADFLPSIEQSSSTDRTDTAPGLLEAFLGNGSTLAGLFKLLMIVLSRLQNSSLLPSFQHRHHRLIRTTSSPPPWTGHPMTTLTLRP